MLYAILCYDDEKAICAWTHEQEELAMTQLGAVEDKLRKQRRLGPVARLRPTSAARTMRKGRETRIVDGPFAETKEQLLGFFIVDCATPEEALETARELGQANPTNGSYEVRPLLVFHPSGELRGQDS